MTMQSPSSLCLNHPIVRITTPEQTTSATVTNNNVDERVNLQIEREQRHRDV